MPDILSNNRMLDARPDRIDFRDKIYISRLDYPPPVFPSPEVVSKYLPRYTELILDQGTEGACTGFGLAAVINFIRWKNNYYSSAEYSLTKEQMVSPRMLYHLARHYDEWDGEDYSGSSCRGAMKGWHKHGVCKEITWPYGNGKYQKPKNHWDTEAAEIPLGAYYRIGGKEKPDDPNLAYANIAAINDMRSAIRETGAIYVSCDVHEGWNDLKKSGDSLLPVIPYFNSSDGGHAFAIVGYNRDGFIIQNSWGKDWGFHGFALLTYENWKKHGRDAWVAMVDAPVRIRRRRSRSQFSLIEFAAGKEELSRSGRAMGDGRVSPEKKGDQFDQDQIYEHSIVIGNNGRPLNRLMDIENGTKAIEEVCYRLPKKWFDSKKTAKKRIMIFAHGGLQSEEHNNKRIGILAPCFEQNGVYPIFITWKTGIKESAKNILLEAVGKQGGTRVEGFSYLREKAEEMLDRFVEVASRKLFVKAIWDEMKENAELSCDTGGGMKLAANQLAKLVKENPDTEIHLVGHSAGSIILGHFLKALKSKKLPASSLHLYAPACSVKFALDHYTDDESFDLKNFFVHILNDEREKADSVGPYSKSILYLVSRALEVKHKTPIIGMEHCWKNSDQKKKPNAFSMWNQDYVPDILKWQKFAEEHDIYLNKLKDKQISDGAGYIPSSHGSFDNDVKIVSETILKIIGESKLPRKITNLRGY